jgi:hypothetical protein
MLPHKEHLEDEFIEQVNHLKARFEVDSKDSVFLPETQQNKVPMIAMPSLIEEIWNAIAS